MPVLQLRNHIPIGSPARREPVDGAESPLRVSLGFEPEWFHRRCGVDFGPRWHNDPRHRCESRRRMKAELERAFPITDYWRSADDREFASLSGCHGIHVISLAFGATVCYHPDRWPVLINSPLSNDDIAALDPDRILGGPFVEGLFRQMDEIAAEWGGIHGYLNWQGVLNNAFHLRGQQLFTDMADTPELVLDLCSVIAEVMIRLAVAVQRRQRESGFAIDQLCVSNCTVNMISPRMYRRFVQPFDARLAASFQRFGVHTCNWNITPYIQALRDLPKVGYLDMGLQSDLPRVRDSFPAARLAVIYSPSRLVEGDSTLFHSDLERIRLEMAPCDIVLADLPLDVPDDHISDFLRIAAELA